MARREAAPNPPVAPEPPAYCTWCGTQAPEGAPPTWTVQTSERGLQVLCAQCTRSNLRSIEANLSTDYW